MQFDLLCSLWSIAHGSQVRDTVVYMPHCIHSELPRDHPDKIHHMCFCYSMICLFYVWVIDWIFYFGYYGYIEICIISATLTRILLVWWWSFWIVSIDSSNTWRSKLVVFVYKLRIRITVTSQSKASPTVVLSSCRCLTIIQHKLGACNSTQHLVAAVAVVLVSTVPTLKDQLTSQKGQAVLHLP